MNYNINSRKGNSMDFLKESRVSFEIILNENDEDKTEI